MRWFYDFFFPVIWIVFLVYWQVMARNVKTIKRLEPAALRVTRMLLFFIAIVLLSYPRIPIPWLYWSFLTSSIWTFYGGAIITVGGLLFAIWGRRHLGGNWSRSVTIKQDHELIVSGPYALVRHPIYTGILTGFLGTAIATTQLRGVLVLALIFIALWAKLRLEERWMREHFGDSYGAYSRRVAALVPFIL